MLKQGAVAQIKNSTITRNDGYLVVTMRFYPRFLKKELRDEFICELAPVKELLADFNASQKRLANHNMAFTDTDYESRFQLSKSALEHLRRLAKLSAKQDVYLFCVCEVGGMCHREMLMLLAHELFGCKIGEVYNDYPVLTRRFKEFAKLVD
jgi:uncharacterized protein YeaO (DUF488 family)